MQKIWFINIYVFHEIRQIDKVYINIHSYVDILKKTSTRSRFKNNNSGSLHATHTLTAREVRSTGLEKKGEVKLQ